MLLPGRDKVSTAFWGPCSSHVTSRGRPLQWLSQACMSEDSPTLYMQGWSQVMQERIVHHVPTHLSGTGCRHPHTAPATVQISIRDKSGDLVADVIMGGMHRGSFWHLWRGLRGVMGGCRQHHWGWGSRWGCLLHADLLSGIGSCCSSGSFLLAMPGLMEAGLMHLDARTVSSLRSSVAAAHVLAPARQAARHPTHSTKAPESGCCVPVDCRATLRTRLVGYTCRHLSHLQYNWA